MAGKHRGPSHRGKRSHLRRVTLEPLIQRAVLRMAATEQRSVGNTISVLVTEAVLARQRRKQRQRARKAGLQGRRCNGQAGHRTQMKLDALKVDA